MSQKIKCAVWDLDNTIWDGTLAESDNVTLKENIVDIIKELDRRGILNSISSKNEYDIAKKKLEEFGLWEYFIYPEIHWSEKSSSINNIAKNINIAIDALAFIDDQIFEREEVKYHLPEILCIDANKASKILDMDEFIPKFITEESKERRKMYQSDIRRNKEEKLFTGTEEEFLKTLNMVFRIIPAQEEDLQRAEELTVRTHQLNSTGYLYSYDELRELIYSDNYEVLIAQLEDKYGYYGTIGLSVVEKGEKEWELKLLLMSCRVMSKGVGNIFMNYIINQARNEKADVLARFIPTSRNRIMYITYKFNGFKEYMEKEDYKLLKADMSYARQMPKYITLLEGRE